MDTENTEQELDLFSADLSGTEPQKNFAAVKAGVYDLQIPADGVKVEIYGNDNDRMRADVQYEFTNAEGLELVEAGIPGRIFHRIYLNTSKGAGFVRAFTDAHGGDWPTIAQQISQGAGLDINGRRELMTQVFKQFEGTACKAKVKVTTSYKDRDGSIVKLDNVRNDIVKYVKDEA